MATIGSLVVELTAKFDSFLSDMAKAEGKIASMAKAGAALTTVGAAIGGSMIAMAKHAADLGDELRDASMRTGATVEQLSVLKFAAEQSGASFSDLNTGLTRLSRNAVEAAEGGKKQAAAFDSLGIAVTDSSGAMRPMNDLLLNVADRFAGMRDGAEKTALAQELFGKGGAALIPVLNEGSEGIRAMGDRLGELNGIMSSETAAAADKFNDAQNEMNKALEGMSVAIGGAVLPALTDVAETIGTVVGAISRWISEHQEIVQAVGVFAAALAGTGGLLVALSAVAAILPALSAGFALLGAAGGPIFLVAALLSAGIAVWVTYGDKIKEFVKNALAYVIDAFAGLLDMLASLPQGMIPFGINVEALRDKMRGWSSDIRSNIAAQKDLAIEAERGKARLEILGSIVDKQIEREQVAAERKRLMATRMAEAAKEADKERDALEKLTNKLGAAADPTLHLIDVNDRLIATYGQFQNLPPIAESGPIKGIRVAIDNADMLQRTLDGIGKIQFEGLKQGTAAAIDHLRKVEEEARNLERATDDVKKSAGAIFDDMFIKGENVFSSLKNLLKGGVLSLGRAIFEDITAALLGPIKKAFDDFFKNTIGGLIRNALGGLGNALGRAFGGAGSTAFGGLVPVPPVKVAGVGGGRGSLGAFFSNPITIAAAAAAVAGIVAWKQIGKGRRTADDFVQKVQNPFHNALAAIVDDVAALKNSGKLTFEQAQAAQSAIEELWANFRTQADEFASQGSTQAKVVQQAFTTLDPIMRQILSDIASDIEALKETTEDATDATEELTDAIDDNRKAVTSGTKALDAATAMTERYFNVLLDGVHAVTQAVNLFSSAVGNAVSVATALARTTIGTPGAPTSTSTTTVAGTPGPMSPTTIADFRRIFGADPGISTEDQFRAIFGAAPRAADGGHVAQTGLAVVHKGEDIIPEGGDRQIHVTFNITALDPHGMNQVVRKQVAPALVALLQGNSGGLRTELSEALAAGGGSRRFIDR